MTTTWGIRHRDGTVQEQADEAWARRMANGLALLYRPECAPVVVQRVSPSDDWQESA